MIGILKTTILLFSLGLSKLVALEPSELYLKCSAKEISTQFVITILAPNPNEDCDIAYDDTCHRTIGSYSLTTDLSDPTNKQNVSQRRYMGTFNEPEESGLSISSEGRFEIQFSPNFRNELQYGKKQTMIRIESFHSTSDPFELVCQKDKFPF